MPKNEGAIIVTPVRIITGEKILKISNNGRTWKSRLKPKGIGERPMKYQRSIPKLFAPIALLASFLVPNFLFAQNTQDKIVMTFESGTNSQEIEFSIEFNEEYLSPDFMDLDRQSSELWLESIECSKAGKQKENCKNIKDRFERHQANFRNLLLTSPYQYQPQFFSITKTYSKAMMEVCKLMKNETTCEKIKNLNTWLFEQWLAFAGVNTPYTIRHPQHGSPTADVRHSAQRLREKIFTPSRRRNPP